MNGKPHAHATRLGGPPAEAWGQGGFKAALGHELVQLPGRVKVHITHIKPGEMEALMSEIGKLASPPRIRALAAGKAMHLRGA